MAKLPALLLKVKTGPPPSLTRRTSTPSCRGLSTCQRAPALLSATSARMSYGKSDFLFHSQKRKLNFSLFCASPPPQRPLPRCHGFVVAPGGVHLCPLQLLAGGERLRGGERPAVLPALLRAVLRPLLCSLPAQDSGGESPNLGGIWVGNRSKNVEPCQIGRAHV